MLVFTTIRLLVKRGDSILVAKKRIGIQIRSKFNIREVSKYSTPKILGIIMGLRIKRKIYRLRPIKTIKPLPA